MTAAPEADTNPMRLDDLRLVLGEGLVSLANRPDAAPGTWMCTQTNWW